MFGSARRGHVCLLVALAVCLSAPAFAQVPDTTPPTITAAATTVANANGWYRTNVRIRFTCADTGSGIAYCPPAVVVSTEGADQLISGVARDRRGNTASASVVVSIDKTAPVVTASRAPEAPASGWSTTPVTVTFAAMDALSGIDPASLTAPITIVKDRTNGSASGRATDLAGNVGKVTLTGINIDQTAPRIKVTLASTVGLNGWRTSAVTAHFVCTDGRSGIAQCPIDQVFDTEGTFTVTGATSDYAGHTASVAKEFKIDLAPPVVTVTAPSASVSEATTTITGRAVDTASGLRRLMTGTRVIPVAADGSFTYGPLTLAEGANTYTFTATDRAGLVREHPFTVTFAPAPPPPPPPACANLVADPQFDLGESGFSGQDASTIVTRTTVNPLEGASSLRVGISLYGGNVWWTHPFSGGRASNLRASARVRVETQTSSELQFCAMAYYQDGTTGLACTTVSGAPVDHGTVSAGLPLDASKPLESVRIRMYQEGSAPITFTLDAVSVCLDVVEPPPPGGGDPGGGGGTGGGGGSATCPAPSASTVYPGRTYQFPTARPYLSMAPYTLVNQASSAYQRFRAAADAALAGNPPYAYSPTQSVLMHAITHDPDYLTDAIARVDQLVLEAEAAIAAGHAPPVAGDSYLEVGWYLEALSFAYDFGFDLLTPAQRQRWTRFGDQAIYNVWHPSEASWNSRPHPWTGWSICDPGNNYHYSFLRATMLWAWARQDVDLIAFLQTQKFPPLMDYFAALPGGGSREGTGYGTAQKNLFETFLYWKNATGEDLSALTPHTRQTIDYWIHATVPTRDRFAPIGDQSRSSVPELYDYHENLVHTAAVLRHGTSEAQRGTWWLQNNSVNGVQHSFNLLGDLLPYPDAPVAPTALSYHASGAGVFFARSSWDTSASWFLFVAGKYDQSHAHQDQGSFTLFKNDWAAVTNNIWSHSGINQGVEVHNVIRFERADGTVIAQNPSDTLESTMVETSAGGTVSASANLTNAYWRNASLVQNWTRDVQLTGDYLKVTDHCTVAPGVVPVFQLQVPVEPVRQENGEFFAGRLRITPLQPVSAWNFVQMPGPEFSRGWRIDLYSDAGCSFNIQLRHQY